MPQHPRLSLPMVKQWHRQEWRDCDIQAVEELLLVLIPIDATLVRHGRTDQARALRKAVSKVIEG